MQKNRASVVKLAPSITPGIHDLQVKIEGLYRKLLNTESYHETTASALVSDIRHLEQKIFNIKSSLPCSVQQFEGSVEEQV